MRTRKREEKRREAGLRIPALKIATNLEAVNTPTNNLSTFEPLDDKIENLGKSRLKSRIK